jgi:signal-transduction protein with cAMP-binding, CBS, and nucleotidyltransferase domain
MVINDSCMTTFFNFFDPTGILTETKKNRVMNNIKMLSVPQKTHLISPDVICKDIYFILEGLFMFYECVDKKKAPIAIFQADDFIIDLLSFTTLRTARLGLICQKNAVVMSMNIYAWKQLCDEEPYVDELFNTYNKKQTSKGIERTRQLIKGNTEDRLQTLNLMYPGVLNFISQKYLADYLGVTEQAISKAKARLS